MSIALPKAHRATSTGHRPSTSFTALTVPPHLPQEKPSDNWTLSETKKEEEEEFYLFWDDTPQGIEKMLQHMAPNMPVLCTAYNFFADDKNYYDMNKHVKTANGLESKETIWTSVWKYFGNAIKKIQPDPEKLDFLNPMQLPVKKPDVSVIKSNIPNFFSGLLLLKLSSSLNMKKWKCPKVVTGVYALYANNIILELKMPHAKRLGKLSYCRWIATQFYRHTSSEYNKGKWSWFRFIEDKDGVIIVVRVSTPNAPTGQEYLEGQVLDVAKKTPAAEISWLTIF